jgi:DNA helicase-4
MSSPFDVDAHNCWEDLEQEIDKFETRTGYQLLPTAVQSLVYEVTEADIKRLHSKREEVEGEVETLRREGREYRSTTEDAIRGPRRNGNPLREDTISERDELRDTEREINALLNKKAAFISTAEQDQLQTLSDDLKQLRTYIDTKSSFDAEISQLDSVVESYAADVDEALTDERLISDDKETDLLKQASVIDSQLESFPEGINLDQLTEADRNRLRGLRDRADELRERVSNHNESVVESRCERVLGDAGPFADTLNEELAAAKETGEPLPEAVDEHLEQLSDHTTRIDELLNGRVADYLSSESAMQLLEIYERLVTHRAFINAKQTFDDEIGEIAYKTDSFETAVTDATDLTDYLPTERRNRILETYEDLRERIDNVLDSVDVEILATADRHELGLLEWQIEAARDQLDGYNGRWLAAMRGEYEGELNSYFDDPAATHTDQQLQAIFKNDNYNRVNAAAGTGKTTTFGRRVHFLLSQYDELSPSDILAVTFTRNGRDEMESELSNQFGINGVNVSTLNSYGKSVAEDQHEAIRFVVEEAKQTDIARIWRALISEDDWQDHYEEFLSAWKEKNYDPDDEQEINSIVETHQRKDALGLLGEEIGRDDIPEETFAHKELTKLLTKYDLDYDYKYAPDWDSESKTNYIFDFRIEDPALSGPVFVEFNPSEATQNDRPWYKNPEYNSPAQLRRFFERMQDTTTEAATGTLIILNGSELLDGDADDASWGVPRVQSKFREAVRKAITEELADRTEFAPRDRSQLSGFEHKKAVYRRYTCERSVVEKVQDFIGKARVREWSPSETSQRVQSYIDEHSVEEEVELFCELAIEAYRRFSEAYDNRERTDFHGSLVLTRDLLQAGEVGDQHLYSHILVDEMQDLNPVQFDLIKQLSKQHDDIRVFGVGDDWQSIFGFRGARPDLFINFGSELEAENYADTRLEANHRCPDGVVSTSNAVIRNNQIRTQKDPSGSGSGEIRVHHLGCDTFDYYMNQAMSDKIVQLFKSTSYDPGDVQILLRQKDGDQTFYNTLAKEVREQLNPRGDGYVDIRTAHDAKGSEAEHVIIPKVITTGGYPSVKPDEWLDPVDQPPEIYQESSTSHQIEEERRLFYVALTRAEERLDILTVEGFESRFIDELPAEHCVHNHPLPEDELAELKQNGEIRRTVEGVINSVNPQYPFAKLDWDDRGIVDMNLFDATDDQSALLEELGGGSRIKLSDCGIQYRNPENEDTEGRKLQLQVDDETSIHH